MRIGLIDVDGRHGKKKWGATIYPNLALGKIARWHTMQGDEVAVVQSATHGLYGRKVTTEKQL